MKTILFIDKKEEQCYQAFRKYDFLIGDFRSAGMFEVCPWDSRGDSVASAIPDLPRALRGETKWQAVIVSDLRNKGLELKADAHFDNPFDFPENYGREDMGTYRESSRPLVRLTQMLGGIPEKAGLTWVKEKAYETEGDSASVVRPVSSEFQIVREVTDEYYEVSKRYRLGVPRPERIICVSPFEMGDEDREARRYVLEKAEEEKYDFWQRNDYPASARFVLCNRAMPNLWDEDREEVTEDFLSDGSIESLLLRKEQRESLFLSQDAFWFPFWVRVLVLMTSTVLPRDLRAYTLYHIDLNINFDKLADAISARCTQWSDTCIVLSDYCERVRNELRPSINRDTPLPDTKVFIPLLFDKVNSENLLSDPSEVQLFRDDPEKDLTVWQNQRSRIRQEFSLLLRAPKRAMAKAASEFKTQKILTFDELEYIVLNDYELDKLKDDMLKSQIELLKDAGGTPFELEVHEEMFQTSDEEIRHHIPLRANGIQAKIALGASVGCLFVGFLPFMLGIAGGIFANLGAIIISALACGVLFGAWYFKLRKQRDELREKYTDFNDKMTKVMLSLGNEAQRLEKRAGKFATFRNMAAILDRQDKLADPTLDLKRYEKIQATIRQRICDAENIALNCGFGLHYRRTGDPDLTFENVVQSIEEAGFYRLRYGKGAEKRGLSEDAGRSFEDTPFDFVSNPVLMPERVR